MRLKSNQKHFLFRKVLSNNKYNVSSNNLNGNNIENGNKSIDTTNNRTRTSKTTCTCGRNSDNNFNKNVVSNSNSSDLSEKNKMKAVANEVFGDFCQKTTIHGMKYLTQSSWYEKLLWITVYVFALWFCGTLVWERYKKWEKNPVIISFDKRFESISEVSLI